MVRKVILALAILVVGVVPAHARDGHEVRDGHERFDVPQWIPAQYVCY